MALIQPPRIVFPACDARRRRRFVAGVGIVVLACAFELPAGAMGAAAEPFGITTFTMQTTEPNPVDNTVSEPYFFDQAGGHPFALTTTVRFATEEVGPDHTLAPTRDPKDIVIELPPGLIANPQAVSRCVVGRAERCPTDAQVGVFVLHAALGGDGGILGPIVNLTPGAGESAELGLETPLETFPLTGRVIRTPEGYTSAIVASDLPALGITSMEITLWGVPAAGAHDPLRGLFCIGGVAGSGSSAGCKGPGVVDGEAPAAFLTTPSGCSVAPTAVAWVDSWEEPGHYAQARSTLPTMAYCERLSFTPEITVRPETLSADRPVGIEMSIRSPQLGDEAIVATPPLRDASVMLPQGVSINPAVAGGLQACDATGPAGINFPTGMGASGGSLDPSETGPGEEPGPSGESQLAPGHCPSESIVGDVEASTPLLAHPIEGRVYMAKPGCGGPGEHVCTDQDATDGTLYHLYIELGSDTRRDEGALIKLEATVEVNPATGQLNVRLTDMPQLPISELSIRLFGGDRALLANPTTCGTATSTADLQSWGAPLTPGAGPSSYYEVEGCEGPRPFDPGFLAGSVDASAAAFTPFTLSVTRKDGEQYLAALQVHAPLGLSAMLASVPLCPEGLASAGECAEASRVGSSEVAAGAGSEPLYMPGGLYLTGPYGGAPFGLAIVTNAVAGPLNLGRLVIRARIEIDPRTAALTITSDLLPRIVLGVPLRIQRISLSLDRPHFVFNPTSCETQQVTATIAGAEAASKGVSGRFALANCASLAFRPRITASTAAQGSLASGASLDVRIAFPKAKQGAEANLARIDVMLPRQLPTRLTSLQSSCPDSVFEGDPAACPRASIVGYARARTSVLPGELDGPVYLLSHGHDVLPSPVVVLQGDGVALELSGSTTIDRKGIGSVAFDATPDVPLGSLELLLTAGPHSLLGANATLCAARKTLKAKRAQRVRGHAVRGHAVRGHAVRGRALRRVVNPRAVKVSERSPDTLLLRSELGAHNGAVVHQTARITVTGCAASPRLTARRSRVGSRKRRAS
jgi:hypothetical protein